MLIENLGPDYVVWDKSASIRYKRPGTGTVRARFELTGDQIEAIRKQAQELPKVEPVFQVSVVNNSGQVIAEVEKILHVRRKERER
jgi:hypothetical protein